MSRGTAGGDGAPHDEQRCRRRQPDDGDSSAEAPGGASHPVGIGARPPIGNGEQGLVEHEQGTSQRVPMLVSASSCGKDSA